MFIILFLFYDTVYLLKILKNFLDISKIFNRKRIQEDIMFHMIEHFFCSINEEKV